MRESSVMCFVSLVPFLPNTPSIATQNTHTGKRSAPEFLEAGRCLSIGTIDTALDELRKAFEEEAQVGVCPP